MTLGHRDQRGGHRVVQRKCLGWLGIGACISAAAAPIGAFSVAVIAPRTVGMDGAP